MYYYFALITNKNKAPISSENSSSLAQTLARSVFLGSISGIFVVYVFWLIVPNHRLDVASYSAIALSFIGLIQLKRLHGFKGITSNIYFRIALSLLPLMYFIDYTAYKSDEFSHWLAAPKAFYHSNTLIPTSTRLMFLSYTPFWTLFSVFTQYFTFDSFNESVIYCVRLGFIFSFLVYVCEAFKTKNTALMLFFVSASYLILSGYSGALLVEMPQYIALSAILFHLHATTSRTSNTIDNPHDIAIFLLLVACAYFSKKSMIAAMIPMLFVFMFTIRKHIIFTVAGVFLLLGLYLSWKFSTVSVENVWNMSFQGNWYVSDRAYHVYKEFFGLSVKCTGQYILVFIALVLMYRHSLPLFSFYALFSLFYTLGLMMTYILAFSGYEGAYCLAYKRYMSIVFVPSYLYILLHVIKYVEEKYQAINKKIITAVICILTVPFVFPRIPKNMLQEKEVFENKIAEINKIISQTDADKKTIYAYDKSDSSKLVFKMRYFGYPLLMEIIPYFLEQPLDNVSLIYIHENDSKLTEKLISLSGEYVSADENYIIFSKDLAGKLRRYKGS